MAYLIALVQTISDQHPRTQNQSFSLWLYTAAHWDFIFFLVSFIPWIIFLGIAGFVYVRRRRRGESKKYGKVAIGCLTALLLLPALQFIESLASSGLSASFGPDGIHNIVAFVFFSLIILFGAGS